jgi:hypothetical protein
LPATGEAVKGGEASGDAGEAALLHGLSQAVEGGVKSGGSSLAGAGFESAVKVGEAGLGVSQ